MDGNPDSIASVSPQRRLMWGIVAGAITLLCWRFFAGAWPDLDSQWWYWLLCLAVTLLGIWLSPLPIVFLRYARALAQTQSPAFRLQLHNCWTEIQHVEGGGSFQMMRMEDENFVQLSLGATTLKVFVRPAPLEDPELQFTEVASSPVSDPSWWVNSSSQHRRAKAETMLDALRTAVGWPKSVEELRRNLKTFGA